MADNQFNLDDEFGRKPGLRRRDPEESLAEAAREEAARTAEQHDKVLEEMRDFARTNSMASEILGGQNNAVLESSPEASKEAHEATHQESQSAPAQNATQSAQSSAEPAAAQETERMAEQSGQKAAEEGIKQVAAKEAAADKTPAAQPSATSSSVTMDNQATGMASSSMTAKPSSLETTLSDIKDTGKRQKYLVLPGDPEIRRRLYERLEAAGKLYYSGGQPMITLNRRQTLKELDKVVKEYGAESVHAMTLKADRYGVGLGSLTAKFSRSHQIDVVLVGKRADLEAKGSELLSVVRTLEEKDLVPKKSAEKLADRIPTGARNDSGDVVRLDAGKHPGPLVIKGGNTLASLLDPVKEKVGSFNREQAEKKDLAREHKAEKEYKDAAAAREKSAQESRKTPSEKVNEHSAKFAKELSTAFQDGNLLHTQNGKGQVAAHAMLERARNLQDPTVRELQTLPEGDRQKAIIQLAALIQKADAKEFGDKLTAKMLDNHKADTSSIRDKVAAFVKMEAERDSAFAAKAEPILKSLVDSKVLTEEQSKALSGQFAAAVETAHKAEATAKPADAAQEQAGASKAETQSTSTEATTQSTSAAAEKTQPAADATSGTATQAAASAEATTAAASTAESKEHGANDTASLAAQSGVQSGVEKTSAAESTQAATPVAEAGQASASTESKTATAGTAETASTSESASVTTHAAEASNGNSVEASVASAPTATVEPTDKPLALRDRLEAHTAEGGEKLTAEKAASIAAELDALRTKPLSSLDSGNGDKPTQTLDNAEKLLKELESGRFGAELKAQAKDLAEPLAKWREQDGQRREAEGLAGGKSAAESVSGEATKESVSGNRGVESPKIAPTTITGTSASHSTVAQENVSAASTAKPEVSAEQLAKQAAEQRYRETEAAGGKLSSLMANPAGSFTNRDKTWNESNIQRAASEVLRIDPQAASEMSSSQRTRLAVYSAWLAENARDGKLPGFSSEQGKELANQLVSRAASLIRVMDDGSATPADVQKSLDKANRLVAAMPQLEQSASFSAGAAERGNRTGISPDAAKSLSNDLVHSVYTAPNVSAGQVTYLLRSVPSLTPEAIKALPPADQAKTVAAMEHLVKKVNEGGLGDVSKLPAGIQENLKATTEAVGVLKDALNKDPAMRSAIREETSQLNGRATSNASAEASAAKAQETAQVPTPKMGGRSLDR
jgi:hypothetical protein